MFPKIFAGVFGGVMGVAGTTLSAAQAADNARVRGTVAKFEGSTLTVKTREGDIDAIKLLDGSKVSGVAKASLGDIKWATLSPSRPCRRRTAATVRSKS